jgi:predicted nucleotidyltransferase
MSKRIDKMEILKHFMEEPNREFHIREMAKITKLTPTTITNHLNEFSKDNLVTKKRERNLVLFRANPDNVLFKEIKRHYNIKNIIKSGLISYINEERNYPESIILFGSYAKSENVKDQSDIDLFILSENKKNLNLEKYEKLLKTEIQTFFTTRKEFEEMKKQNKELLNNVLNGIRLHGFLEVFK